MLKPRVGEMVWTSSPLNFLRIVVLPALPKPLKARARDTFIQKEGERD